MKFYFPQLGHDTTASAISWCLYTLAKHPDIQEQAYEEVKSLMAGRDSDHMVWYVTGSSHKNCLL